MFYFPFQRNCFLTLCLLLGFIVVEKKLKPLCVISDVLAGLTLEFEAETSCVEAKNMCSRTRFLIET